MSLNELVPQGKPGHVHLALHYIGDCVGIPSLTCVPHPTMKRAEYCGGTFTPTSHEGNINIGDYRLMKNTLPNAHGEMRPVYELYEHESMSPMRAFL